jgi:hypothetical protein
MPFSPDDIKPIGHMPGSTAFDYSVSRDGKEVGVVRFVGAFGVLNSGRDPREHIARRLGEVEQSEGFEKLASALRSTLEM